MQGDNCINCIVEFKVSKINFYIRYKAIFYAKHSVIIKTGYFRSRK